MSVTVPEFALLPFSGICTMPAEVEVMLPCGVSTRMSPTVFCDVGNAGSSDFGNVVAKMPQPGMVTA